MDVGVGLWQLRSTARAPVGWPRLYRDLQEDARLAEELGFHSLWLSEHHFWYDGWCPSLAVAAAAALGATTRLRVGTGILILPLHEPDRLAAQCRTLHAASGGRFELGIGLGYRDSEYDGLGLRRRTRGRRADEALDVILATRRADAGGPEIWVGGMGERSLARATTRGLGLFLPPTLRLEDTEKVIAASRAAATEAGVTLGPVGIVKSTWVTRGGAADEQRGRDDIVRATKEYAGSWWSLRGELGWGAPDLLDKQMQRSVDTALVGSPEAVVADLEGLAAAGVDLVVLNVSSDVTRPDYRDTMRLIASDVLPRVVS